MGSRRTWASSTEVDAHRQDWSRLSKEELEAQALEGHAEAWDEIIRRHTHRVVVVLLARGVPLDVAEELTQEAWLRLVQQQRAGHLHTLQFPGLAIAQARWLAMEANRSRARREAIAGAPMSLHAQPQALEITDPALDPEQRTQQRQLLEAVQKELRRCPPRAQQIFRAVYGMEARRPAEVARDLGLSVQRVRQILCEVRARLRHALDGREGESEPWNT